MPVVVLSRFQRDAGRPVVARTCDDAAAAPRLIGRGGPCHASLWAGDAARRGGGRVRSLRGRVHWELQVLALPSCCQSVSNCSPVAEAGRASVSCQASRWRVP